MRPKPGAKSRLTGSVTGETTRSGAAFALIPFGGFTCTSGRLSSIGFAVLLGFRADLQKSLSDLVRLPTPTGRDQAPNRKNL